jgi:AsmA family
MNEAKPVSPPPGKRRRWLRILAGIFGVLLLLLIVGWFVVTSSAFFKGMILPRVSKAMNANVTVDDAVISPFSQVILRNLKVQTTGMDPLVTAAEVRVRYHLMDIIGGNFNVDEIALVSTTINLVQNADGTSNLDPLLKSVSSKETKNNPPAKSPGSSKPLRVSLKKLALTDATIRQIKNYPGGQSAVTELSNVNVTLDNVKNGDSGKLQLNADVKIDNHPPSPAASGNLLAKVAGNFDFTFSTDLKPVSVKGNTHLDVTQAGGAMQDLSALAADFDCEVTPTDITQIALHFQKSGTPLGEVRVSGPFDSEKSDGHLKVEILALDRQVLNLFGAASGIDFGTTTITSTNQIDLAKSGSSITASGQLAIANLQVIRAGQSTPTLDASVDYNVMVDRTAQTALLRTLTFTATQNRQPLAHAELSSPMNLSWNDANNAAGDSALNVGVTGLNLADWKPFLGETVAGGNVVFNAKLLSQSGGKQLVFNLDSQISNLTANFGGNQIKQAGVNMLVRGQAVDFKQFKLEEYRVQLSQQDQPLLTVAGSGTSGPGGQNADIQVQLQAAVPGLLTLLPQADANISTGTIALTAQVTQKEQTQTVTGKFSLAALTGRFGKNEFHNFTSEAGFDVTKNGDQIQIRQATGKLTGDEKAGGSFEISGDYDVNKNSGRMMAKLTDFNENGLRPFLEPLLADKKLVSVAINATASAQFGPPDGAAVKANLRATDFVVSDPTGQFPATPLEATFQLDVTASKQVADVRQFQITLTPTARAKNELQLTGTVDFSRTNNFTGNLKLAADTLDLTRYYDLFASQAKPVAATAPPPTTNAPPVANANEEPAPMNLPLRNFTVDATITRLYLREVDMANFQMTAQIDGGHVMLKPCEFTLNGAPANATVDLDLGVPGYRYEVNFNANRVPIAPLVNSFSPAYKDKARGDLIVGAKIKGAGVTGKSLKNSLAGNADIVLTNADIDISSKNPNAGKLAKFINGTITVISTALGLNELLTSPVTGLDVHSKMGDGKITATEIVAGSAAFQAQLAGTITLTDVLTNSTIDNWPVHLALGRASAQRLGWVPPNAPASQTYFMLPDFETLTGTIGVPGTKMDKIALAGILGRSGLGIANTLTGKAANGSTNTVDQIEKVGKKLFDFLKKK